MEVVCELLPVINTFNVFVRTINNENIKNVEITERSIKLKDENSKDITLKLNGGICLKKATERDLRCELNWVCFRAQLEHKTKIVNSVLMDVVREVSKLDINSQHISDQVNIPMQLRCKCGFPITDFKVYKKICPLPMADWDHVSESWFCHLHDDQKDLVKKKGFNPQENEIYFNELFFNVNVKSVLVEISGDSLHCKCSTEIGFRKGETLKFWTNDVNWADETKVICEKTSREILYTLVQNLEKESLGSSPRLVLESIGSTKDLLYIVTMDNHLNLFVTSNSPFNDEMQKTISKKQRIDELNSMSLKKLQCIKVLYKHKTELDDETGLWMDDVNVHVLQCGSSFLTAVLCLLEHSNVCIPDSLRIVRDLKIGYILK